MLFPGKSDSWEIIAAFTQARCRTAETHRSNNHCE
jgi:hypothetical protein